MNGAQLGLGIATAVLSLGAIASSLLAANRSNATQKKVAKLNVEATKLLADQAQANDLQEWLRRNVMFPEGQKIVDLLADLSGALLALSLDLANINQLPTHLGKILQLRYKISGRADVFTAVLLKNTPTKPLEDSLIAFKEAFMKIDESANDWQNGSFLGPSLEATQNLSIQINVAMSAEARYQAKSGSPEGG